MKDKEKRLVDISAQTGVSNWLTTISIRTILAPILGLNETTMWFGNHRSTKNLSLWK